MKIIALINLQGGVGKTTSAINIGAGLTMLEKKVLLIDLDPQANLTYFLGIQAHELKKTVYKLLKKQATVEEVLIERNGLKLIPSSIELAGIEIELSEIPGREFLLEEALCNLRGFDYVLVDCSPSLGLLTLNALVAAQEVYIPVQTRFPAPLGQSKLLAALDMVKSRLNSRLEIAGAIATRFDRRILSRDVLDKIKDYFGKKLFNTIIREDVSLAEAPNFGQTIFEYRPYSYGAKDYLNICDEIIERG